MIVRIHGFDWEAYTGTVMPAFAHWLIDGDENAVHQLYKQTRSAREEHYLPSAMQPASNWSRAQAFMKQLPRGSHTRHEYQLLSTAAQFTPLSDRYIHRHPPQLFQNSDAVRAIWGALLEEYCQSWFTLPPDTETLTNERQGLLLPEQPIQRGEIIALLNAAGLPELARQVSERTTEPLTLEEDEDDCEEEEVRPEGVAIGHLPATLHLRGWLAGISIRAMALFELLACGRRIMPFGYRANEPYENFIGYLTPEECWQLTACLRQAQPPTVAQAQEDYARFRLQQHQPEREFRLLDEVLPVRAAAFLKVVQLASQYGLGLICSVG